MLKFARFVAYGLTLVLVLVAWSSARAQEEAKQDQAASQPSEEKAAEMVDKDAAKKAEAPKEPAAEPEKVDPFEVPEGSVEDLLAYIGELKEYRVRRLDEFLKQNTALLAAAEKIQAAEPDKAQLEEALTTKLKALSGLLRFSKPDEIVAKLEGMPEEFKNAGLEDHVRDATREVLSLKASQLRSASEEEADQLLAKIIDFLRGGQVSTEDVGLAMNVGRTLESGDTDKAAKIYTEFGKLFADSENEQIAGYGAKMEGVARRIQLLGKEMPLEGMTLDGEKLDWSRFEGKVVLVDFWATWCGPCLREIPNIEKNYQAYHDLGFDVISISVDQDRAALEKFVEEHKHPWTVLWDPAAKEAEGMKSMSTYYGVMGIPTFVLIGADGKVAALNPRGEKLGEELAKLLGPPPEKKKAEEEPEATSEEPKEDS